MTCERVENRLNAWPQFRTQIDGLGIHFLHVRSRHESAAPIVLAHGWPGSVIEFLAVIGPLTDPESHGGRPEDAFHVIIPSLPGYGMDCLRSKLKVEPGESTSVLLAGDYEPVPGRMPPYRDSMVAATLQTLEVRGGVLPTACERKVVSQR